MKQIPTPTTTVSFYELAGSPVEAFTSEGFEAKRRFLVRWEEREAFARDVMGHSSTFNYQSSTYYPNRTSVFPVKITFRPADEKEGPPGGRPFRKGRCMLFQGAPVRLFRGAVCFWGAPFIPGRRPFISRGFPGSSPRSPRRRWPRP